jgi:DNA-directed RNA polymerase specialized sigma24 family protein
MTEDDRVLFSLEVAEILRCSESTVRRMVQRGSPTFMASLGVTSGR